MKRNRIASQALLLVLFMASHSIFAQLPVRISRKIENKVSQETDKAVDKALSSDNSDMGTKESAQQRTDGEDARKASYKSKFDFLPGEQVLYFYDFSDVSVGDVPSGWQIDGSAEVVEVEGYEGHYMMIHQKSSIIPETFEDLPDDLTIQYDLICTDPFAWGSNQLYFAMAQTNPNNIPKGQEDHLGSVNNSVLWLSFHPGSQAAAANKGHGAYKLRTKNGIKEGTFPAESFTDQGDGRLARISIWKQKKRVRVYVNENKVLDLPSLLPEDMVINTFAWSAYSYYNQDTYFIGNIRIAAGLPDTRKSLLQNGKYVTTGIQFDTNSAMIKPESFGVLKEIASMLQANPGTRITIVGHTDSDGDETANLDLSKRRAESVKKALVNDFGIDGNLLLTDGKGETEPVANNDSSQNKANNRRVEFLVSPQ